MRFRGIALLMHQRFNANTVKLADSTSNAVFETLVIVKVETKLAMDRKNVDFVTAVLGETDVRVVSEGIVYPAGAWA